MTNQKKGSSGTKWFFGIIGILLLGFFIQYGLPPLKSFYQETMTDNTVNRYGTPIPPTPGLITDMDERWIYCAEGTKVEWDKRCDDLVTDNDELIEYREFGSTCGGRFDNIWGVNCTDLKRIRAKAPPDGVLVLPWRNKNVRTLCLESHESYDSIRTDFIPLTDFLRKELFRRYIFAIVNEECDAVLTMRVSGVPLSARYTSGLRYTGAEVRGSMSLTAPGFPELTNTFFYEKSPPVEYSYDENNEPGLTPEDAPFHRVNDQILDILLEWFGPRIE